MGFSKITKHPAFAPAVSGFISFGVGLIVGNIIWKRSDSSELHQNPMVRFNLQELEKLKEMATNGNGKVEVSINGKGEVETSVVEDIERSAELVVEEAKLKSVTIVPHTEEDEDEVTEVVLERRSVFASGEGWDLEKEMALRTPDSPYCIHQDEFFANDTDFRQTTYTYYAKDNILVDQDSVPIYTPENKVGEYKFGHGTDQPDVFYVRNEKLREEYEIVREHKWYAREVEGLEVEEELEAELQHSSVIKRFRPEE